jgi:hypothetical protein
MEHNFSKKHFSLIFCLYTERLFVRFQVFTAVSTKKFFFGNLFHDAFSVTILYGVDNRMTSEPGSSGSIVSGYGLDNRAKGSILGRGERFFL